MLYWTKGGLDMNVHETGVLDASNIYFHNPSELAQRLYFFPLCTGHYYCTERYLVQRQQYDSYLFLYVKRGSGFATVGHKRVKLAQGSLALVDCYAPHTYGTGTGWEILWLHYDGVLAKEYFRLISQGKNAVCYTSANPYGTQQHLEKIYRMYHEENKASEPLINQHIVGMLTELLTHAPTSREMDAENICSSLCAYITEHMDQPLSLEQMARQASLSPYYFSRLFKEETGYTSHQYLVMVRINAAKYYLKSTNLSIKQITQRCGFSSQSNFCAVFRRFTGETPGVYRDDDSEALST